MSISHLLVLPVSTPGLALVLAAGVTLTVAAASATAATAAASATAATSRPSDQLR